MKQPVVLSFLLVAALVAFSGKHSENILTYTESSTGLQTINLDGGRTEIEMADLNLDGHLDFISIGDHGNPNINTQEHGVMLWYGNGSGNNWSLLQNGNFGYGGIAVGDVNDDGKPDIGYGMHHNYSATDFGNQLIETALGDGTGMNWAPWDDSLGTQGETYGMFSTDFGDYDNDGLLDIGAVSFGCCNGLRLYKNLGNGIWRTSYTVNGGNTAMDFIFGDMNNDGNLDFAVAHNGGTPYFGDGSGNFVLRHNNLPAPTNFGFKGVSLGDVNGDGAKDLAFISSGGAVNVWKWNSTNQNWDNLSTGLPGSGVAAATDLNDMNMDGFIDLVVYGGTDVTIWGGNGGTSWTLLNVMTAYSSPGTYSDFTIGDADHNGYPDIVIEASEGSRNKIKFFKENTPFATLSVTPKYPRGFERFKNNSIKFVEWLCSAPQGQNTKVKLEFSQTGNSGPWSIIADSLPNNGRHQWKVPPSVNSANCYIKYTAFVIGGSNSTAVTPNAFIIGNVVGVNNNNNQIPVEFNLYQNYPNPFNPSTEIMYQIPAELHVELTIYNSLGERITTLVNGQQKPGTYTAEWNSAAYPSGIYYYRLTAGNYSSSKKLVLIK